MRDPTLDEMREFLNAQPFADELRDDIDAAIYWFANDYHGGQGSSLYSALCSCDYRPGPITTLETETEGVAWLYDELQHEYARP